MRSFLAALRTLVLPYGKLNGKRIVLDGVLGRISVFNEAGVEVGWITSELSADLSRDYVLNALHDSGGGFFQTTKIAGGAILITDTSADSSITYTNRGITARSNAAIDFDTLEWDPGQKKWSVGKPIFYDGSWNAITFANLWTGTGEIRRMADGMVQMRGTAVAGATQVTGMTIANIAAPWRPDAGVSHEFMVARSGAYGTSKVTVSPTGVVQYWVNDAVWNCDLVQVRYPKLA